MSIRLDFYSKSVKADIAKLPERMRDAALGAIMTQAHLIVGVAQILVRVDTGSLRDSGRVERGGEGEHWARVRVRFGGYIVNPKTGRLVDYAQYVEAKYPFLKIAVALVKPTIKEMIKARVVEACSK